MAPANLTLQLNGAYLAGARRRRDEPETHFYLQLPEAICTLPTNDEVNVPETGVPRVQLVLDQSGYTSLRPVLGKMVTLRGSLFAEHTGHHHAPLLLKVVLPIEGLDK